jgi:spore cortex biosynthesis protein YabQ
MNEEIIMQLQFFAISILWGGIILLIYDVLRIFRRLKKHGNIMIAAQDILFWIAASIFIFVMIYQVNNGIIRGFCVMGMAIGMVIYHFILSEFFVEMVTRLLRLLLKPFGIVLGVIRKAGRAVGTRCKKAVKFIKSQLKKSMKSVKISGEKSKKE